MALLSKEEFDEIVRTYAEKPDDIERANEVVSKFTDYFNESISELSEYQEKLASTEQIINETKQKYNSLVEQNGKLLLQVKEIPSTVINEQVTDNGKSFEEMVREGFVKF